MNKHAVSMSAIKALLVSAGRGTKALGKGLGTGFDDTVNLAMGNTSIAAKPLGLAGKSETAYNVGRAAVPGALLAGSALGAINMIPGRSEEDIYLDKLRNPHPYRRDPLFRGYGPKTAAHVQGYIDKCAELGVDAEKLAQAVSGENEGVLSKAERAAAGKEIQAAGKKKTYTDDQIAGNWETARTTAAINRMAAKPAK